MDLATGDFRVGDRVRVGVAVTLFEIRCFRRRRFIEGRYEGPAASVAPLWADGGQGAPHWVRLDEMQHADDAVTRLGNLGRT